MDVIAWYNSPMDKDKLYKAFIEWKARPIVEGIGIQTVDEFCEKYKTDKKQLLVFTDSPTFSDDLVTETLLWAKGKTPELVHTVYNQIKLSKSVTDLAKFLELVHGIKEKKDSTTNTQYNFFNNLDDTTYRNIINRESRLLKARSTE